MIIFYPEEYRENAPKCGDVRFYPTKEKFLHSEVGDSGLYDTFVLKVGNFEGEDTLNYRGHKELSRNIHYFTTFVDCRFHSKNLEVLVSKIKAMEDIWNNEG